MKPSGLKNHMLINVIEAGCDEAGRGCLAGPVFAASVILPKKFYCKEINDSKKLTKKERDKLRIIIEKEAISFSISICSTQEIETLNILWASIEAMHKSIKLLKIEPEHIIVDGNKFKPYKNIPHTCIIKGDSKYMSIASASILAKTYRDEYMEKIDAEYPMYDWKNNKGYPTKKHRNAIKEYGISCYHRKNFKLIGD